jgi:FlaA1/EpsC-like NDP-sugar epimerase
MMTTSLIVRLPASKSTNPNIQQMIDETGAQEILLALPSSTRARRREILTLLERFPCTSAAFQTSPTWPAAG